MIKLDVFGIRGSLRRLGDLKRFWYVLPRFCISRDWPAYHTVIVPDEVPELHHLERGIRTSGRTAIQTFRILFW
jgi:hypothetical protein